MDRKVSLNPTFSTRRIDELVVSLRRDDRHNQADAVIQVAALIDDLDLTERVPVTLVVRHMMRTIGTTRGECMGLKESMWESLVVRTCEALSMTYVRESHGFSRKSKEAPIQRTRADQYGFMKNSGTYTPHVFREHLRRLT